MKTNKSLNILALVAGFCTLTLAPSVSAVVVYATGNSLGLYAFDVNVAAGTSSLLRTYSIDSSSFQSPSAGLGGIAVVGNTIYATGSNASAYPEVRSGIFKFDAATGATLGFIQMAPRQMTGLTFDGMAGLAWDGANFWTASTSGDYGYQVDLAGNTINRISFSQSAHLGISGLEYFNGMIIANDNTAVLGFDLHFPRAEPNHFSVYTPQGGLVAGKLITSLGRAVAFDGNNFLIAGSNSTGAFGLYVYDGETAAFDKFIPTPPSIGDIRDLSVDYSLRADAAVRTVPEGGSALGLFTVTLLLCAVGRWCGDRKV